MNKEITVWDLVVIKLYPLKKSLKIANKIKSPIPAYHNLSKK